LIQSRDASRFRALKDSLDTEEGNSGAIVEEASISKSSEDNKNLRTGYPKLYDTDFETLNRSFEFLNSTRYGTCFSFDFGRNEWQFDCLDQLQH